MNHSTTKTTSQLNEIIEKNSINIIYPEDEPVQPAKINVLYGRTMYTAAILKLYTELLNDEFRESGNIPSKVMDNFEGSVFDGDRHSVWKELIESGNDLLVHLNSRDAIESLVCACIDMRIKSRYRESKEPYTRLLNEEMERFVECGAINIYRFFETHTEDVKCFVYDTGHMDMLIDIEEIREKLLERM